MANSTLIYYKRIYTSLILLLSMHFISAPAWACSSAVVSGKVTPDGRPLLWKHRDTGHLPNHMQYIKGEKYDFVANFNSGDYPNLNEAWVGANTAGFALMNTQSYNLVQTTRPSSERGPANGLVMFRALEVCATISDFCHFLDTIQKPSGIESNFGVIDAQGGAAMFEVGEESYKMFDANDPNVAPYGYVARTNFSYGGEVNAGSGYVRYLEVERVLSKASATGGITPHLIFSDLSRSFRNNFLDIDLRNGNYNQPKASGWFVDQDFIPRNLTSCSIVVQGVRPKENPELTVLWTVLGYPPTGIAVPLWVKDNLPPCVSYHEKDKAAPLSAASLKMAREKVFHYKQGGGTKQYLHWENLYNLKGTGIMQRFMPIEEEILKKATLTQQENIKQGKAGEERLNLLYKEIESTLYQNGILQ